MSLLPGHHLGPFLIVQQLGQGGMGVVYKAHHSALDRYVAIKVLPTLLADNKDLQDYFNQEARSLARLKHPHIVNVYDFNYDRSVAYLVLELIEGPSLSDRMMQPFDLRSALGLLTPLAQAIDYAHSLGLLHRDIKPANILLRSAADPVLADFGLAQLLSSIPRFTTRQSIPGTPEYMSPEQANSEPLTPQSDLYSLAVVAYEMLTHRLPLIANTPSAYLLAHISQSPLPVEELKGELFAHLQAVFDIALAKDPLQRFPSAHAFIQALTPAAWPTVSSRPTPLPQAFSRTKHPRVLVVDDNDANTDLIEACLSEIDCEVILAHDGTSALQSIQVSPPDLILLDAHMPGLDGYQVCQQIRFDAKFDLIPIVMLTSADTMEDRVAALEAGATDFLTKPVQHAELLAHVRSALRTKLALDSALAQARS